MAVMIFHRRHVGKEPVNGRLEDPEQITLMRQSKSLWQLVQYDPRFSYYGRMVSLRDPHDDAIEIMISLARHQGAGSCQYYPADSAVMFCAALEKQGLRAVRFHGFVCQARCRPFRMDIHRLHGPWRVQTRIHDAIIEADKRSHGQPTAPPPPDFKSQLSDATRATHPFRAGSDRQSWKSTS